MTGARERISLPPTATDGRRASVRLEETRQSGAVVHPVSRRFLARASSTLLVLVAAACSSSTDLSPPDTVSGDAEGSMDDGSGAEASCLEIECAASCRAAGYADGYCRGPVCQCGNPEGCTVGETTPCYSGPPGTAGVGACTMGRSTCVATSGEFPQWGPCEGEGRPTAEVCNEVDDDCDGFADEDLGCLPPGEPCTEGDICLEGQRCVEFPSGRQVCDDPDPCSGPDSRGECERWEQCVEFPDGSWNCYEQPRTTCWAHFWFDVSGHHVDSCMNCTGRPGLEGGSTCAAWMTGPDLFLDCSGSFGMEARRASAAAHTDFLAMDLPLANPFEITRCLVAWGVHRLVRLDDDPALPGSPLLATVSIPGGASRSAPLEDGGLRTTLPAAAFQHHFVEPPPLPAVSCPTSKEQRAARVFWEEPSAAAVRTTALAEPYVGCPSCVTYEDLIRHMYPGPEVFCQGVLGCGDPGNEIADSMYVVPFWMPYYDTALSSRNHAILSEIVCELPRGELLRSVTSFVLPWEWPASLPASFP